MKKQPERTAATRSLFIETFIYLSEQKPIETISVSELAKKTGFNRSTFYQYFNDTHHLLSCIEDDTVDFITHTLISKMGTPKTDKLFTELFIQVYQEKGTMLKFLFLNSNGCFPAKLKNNLISAFAEKMQLSLEDTQTLFSLDFYLSGMISIIGRWITSEPPISPEEFALTIHRIVDGVRKSELFPIL